MAKTQIYQDCPESKVCYAVDISSQYGTEREISLNDFLPQGQHVRITNLKVKERDDSPCTVQGGTVACTFPPLNSGGHYTVTYQSEYDADYEGNITNRAEVRSSRSGSHEGLFDHAEHSVYLHKPHEAPSIPSIEKKCNGKQSDGTLSWIITVNTNNREISGWTLNDKPGPGVGKPKHITVRNMRTGISKSIDTLPLSFDNEHDKDAYEITYVTDYDTALARADYSNNATLIPPAKEGSPQTSSNTSGAQYHAPNNVITKQGVNVAESENADETVLTWTVSINGKHEHELRGPWTIRDTLHDSWYPLSYTQSLNEQQQQQLRSAVKKAFSEAGLQEPTITMMNTDGNITGFEVRSAQTLPIDRDITFQYDSTACARNKGAQAFAKASVAVPFANTATVGGFSATAQLRRTPTGLAGKVRKIDTTESTHSQDSQTLRHAENKLPRDLSGKEYLQWDIEWLPSAHVVDEAQRDTTVSATLDEHLPQGMQLVPMATLDQTGKNECSHESCVDGIRIIRFDKPEFGVTHSGHVMADSGAVADPYWGPEQIRGQQLVQARISKDHAHLTITLSNSMLRAMAQNRANWERGEWERAKMTFRIYAQFTGDGTAHIDTAAYHQQRSFTNEISWKTTVEEQGKAKNTQVIFDDAHELSKEAVLVDGERKIVSYQLEVNPKAICFASDGKASGAQGPQCSVASYTIDDIAKYLHDEAHGSATLNTDPTTVKLWEDAGPEKETACPAGNQEFITLSHSKRCVHAIGIDSFGFSATHIRPANSNQWAEHLRFIVPNGRHMYVEYSYMVGGDLDSGKQVPIDNSATFGSIQAKPTRGNTMIQLSQATAGIEGFHMTLQKVDEENQTLTLPGAQFQFYEWNGTKFVKVGNPLRTDAHGEILINKERDRLPGFVPNKAYMVQEIAAPQGYQLNKEQHYFLLQAKKTDIHPLNAPKDFSTYSNLTIIDSSTVKPLMVITNKRQIVSLPGTGGEGTYAYVFLGLALVGAALMGISRMRAH